MLQSINCVKLEKYVHVKEKFLVLLFFTKIKLMLLHFYVAPNFKKAKLKIFKTSYSISVKINASKNSFRCQE